jgi:hypothetical protein
LNLSLNAAFTRPAALGEVRSALAAGQLNAFGKAVLSDEVRYAPKACAAKGYSGKVENAQRGGKPIGSGDEIL